MNLTEKEAKTKFCCSITTYSCHTVQSCKASNCMAWRWHEQIEEIIYEEPEIYSCGLPKLPKIKHMIYKSKDEWTGYCGLAGKI